MLQFLFIVGLLLLILLLVKFDWGVCTFIIYLFLVPTQSVYLNGHVLTSTILQLFVLCVLIFNTLILRKKIRYKFLIPFIFLYSTLLFLIPFQTSFTPFLPMINLWRQNIMDILFIAFVIINMPLLYQNFYTKLKWSIILVIFIVSAYGLFLTLSPGINPYLLTFEYFTDFDFNESYASGVNGGRLFGRISSVFLHPMTLGFFLSMSFVYLLYIKESINRFLFYILILCLLMISFLHGVRTTIITQIICLLWILYKRNSFKDVFAISIFVSIVLVVLFMINEEALSYLQSMVGLGKNADEISGSNLDLRIRQLGGAISELSKSPLWGQGYGWNAYYQALHGDHPVLLAFESLLYVVLCNFGILGVLIYAKFAIMLKQNNRKYFNNSKWIFADALVIGYFLYSLITGEYGYMKFFIIFYSTLYIGQSESVKICLKRRK